MEYWFIYATILFLQSCQSWQYGKIQKHSRRKVTIEAITTNTLSEIIGISENWQLLLSRCSARGRDFWLLDTNSTLLNKYSLGFTSDPSARFSPQPCDSPLMGLYFSGYSRVSHFLKNRIYRKILNHLRPPHLKWYLKKFVYNNWIYIYRCI